MAERVMIVDDDQDDLKTMKELLEKEGYKVVTAEDGATALDQLTKDGFKLILIDVKMPTLSGYDLLRLAREKINHSAKMIYVSIVPEKEINLEDADGFIQKPFTPESFLKVIKESV